MAFSRKIFVDKKVTLCYNWDNLLKGCEGKSNPADAMQRAPVWCEGVWIGWANMVPELRRRYVVCDGCAR